MLYDMAAAGGFSFAYFNLNTGATGSASGGISSGQLAIEDLGTGWYLCKINGVTIAGGANPQFYLGQASADGSWSYAGDGSSYMWYASPRISTPLSDGYVYTDSAPKFASPANDLSAIHYDSYDDYLSTTYYPNFSAGMTIALGAYLEKQQTSINLPLVSNHAGSAQGSLPRVPQQHRGDHRTSF